MRVINMPPNPRLSGWGTGLGAILQGYMQRKHQLEQQRDALNIAMIRAGYEPIAEREEAKEMPQRSTGLSIIRDPSSPAHTFTMTGTPAPRYEAPEREKADITLPERPVPGWRGTWLGGRQTWTPQYRKRAPEKKEYDPERLKRKDKITNWMVAQGFVPHDPEIHGPVKDIEEKREQDKGISKTMIGPDGKYYFAPTKKLKGDKPKYTVIDIGHKVMFYKDSELVKEWKKGAKPGTGKEITTSDIKNLYDVESKIADSYEEDDKISAVDLRTMNKLRDMVGFPRVKHGTTKKQHWMFWEKEVRKMEFEKEKPAKPEGTPTVRKKIPPRPKKKTEPEIEDTYFDFQYNF